MHDMRATRWSSWV